MVPGDKISPAEDPVVVTLRVALLPGLTDVGAKEQPMPWPVGTVQLSVTALLKPFFPAIATLKVAPPPGEMVAAGGDGVTVKFGAVCAAQEGKLNEAIRVDQALPVAGIYSVVNQKVQSSLESIAMLA